jgi:hypothetical protein
VTSWQWNFGDGSAATTQNPVHIYAGGDSFFPSLVATNNLGFTVLGSGPSVIGVGPRFIYTTNNGTITIAGYVGPGGAVVIPATINGLPVTSIGPYAFQYCTSMTSVTIPNSVSNIGDQAFYNCTSLTSVYFKGNAPSLGSYVFPNNATVYYLPGTTGWGSAFADRPTAQWMLPNPLILTVGPSFGVQSNRFGFVISWSTNVSVVVEACTDVANPTWVPVGTNTLTGGSSYFSDPDWTNYPARFYRIRSP